MRMKRVLIINTGSLLMDGVKGLLESNSNFGYDVVSTATRNPDDLIREIRRLNPTVIVIEDITPYITPAHLISSLHTTKRIRVVAISSHASKVDIYDKYEADSYDKSELLVSNPARLFEVIAAR